MHTARKILCVVNSRSGRGNTDWKELLRAHYANSGTILDFFSMPVADARDRLRVKLRNFHPDLVVAAGGDGTVSFVAAELVNTEIPMAILPAGSANGMATELRIPASPEQALRMLHTGEVRDTDVIMVNDERICLHMSDIGLNAQLVKYFQKQGLRGILGYGLALLKAMWRMRCVHVVLKDGNNNTLERKAVMVMLANAGSFGTGAVISPQSSICDGVFEVVIVRKLHIPELLKMFRRRQRVSPRVIEILNVRSVRMDTSRRIHFQVDGEYVGKVKHVHASVLAGRLKLLAPPVTERRPVTSSGA